MNILQQNVVELIANAVRTSTLTPSNGVDIRQYDGPAHLVFTSSAATAGTSPTLNVKLQHSHEVSANFEDVSGFTFAAVTDAADTTQMKTLQISDLRRYIRCVATIGGTNTPTFGFAVSMVACRHAGRNASQAV